MLVDSAHITGEVPLTSKAGIRLVLCYSEALELKLVRFKNP